MADKARKQETDLSRVLQSILEKAQELTKGEAGDLRLLDVDKQVLVLSVLVGKRAKGMPERIPVGKGVTGWVAQHKTPCIVPDVRSDERYIRCIEGMKSELAVPLLRGETLIGVLNVESPRLNAFDQSDARLLEASATLAAIAVENAKLLEEARRELDALRGIGSTLCSTHDPEQALSLIANKAMELLGAANIRIRLRRGEYLDPVVHRGAPLGATRWMVGQGIVGLAAQSGQPINVPDVRKNPYFMQALRSIKDPEERKHWDQIRSDLAVPLTIGNRIIGVINAHSSYEAAFSDRHMQLLSLLADQAAVAIENANLWRTIEELHEVGVEIAPNLDEALILKEITGRLNEFINVDIPLTRTYDLETDTFSNVVLGDISREWAWCIPRDDAGSGAAAIKRRDIVVVNEDDQEGPGISPYARRKSIKTTVAAPLISGETPLGVMYLHFLGEKHQSRQREKDRLASLANQIADIVKHIGQQIGFCWESSEKLHEMKDSVSREIASRKINEEISELTKADFILIYLYDEQKRSFGNLIFSSLGKEWAIEGRQLRPDGTGATAIKTGELIIVGANGWPSIHPFCRQKGVKTSAVYPLVFKGRTLGVLYMHFLEMRELSEQEKKAIAVFGTHAAIAVERAIQFRDLKILYDVGRAITAGGKALTAGLHDLRETVGRITEEIAGVIPGGILNIYRYRPESNSFKFLGGVQEGEEGALGRVKPRANGIGKAVIRTGEQAIVHAGDPFLVELDGVKRRIEISPSALEKGIRSVACFPLMFKESIQGVLYLHFRGRRRFNESDVLKLLLLADHVAIAINNAEQYELLRDYAEEVGRRRLKKPSINRQLIIEPPDFWKDLLVDEGKIAG